MAGFAERVWVVEPGIDQAGIAAVCESFASFAAAGGTLVACDVAAITGADLVTVSLLARMQLTARRLGRRIELLHAPPGLAEMIGFCGLDGVLPVHGGAVGSHDPPRACGLSLEAGREAKQREQPVHVEEVVETFDPAV